jgi:competence protein ComGC
MKLDSKRGFTLVEFIIAIVFVGVVLGPFLVFVARIHDLNSAIGQQGRKEAWRSFNDQALVAGIDVGQAPGLTTAANAAIPAIAAPAIAEADIPVIAGLPRIIPLRTVADVSVAEPRMVAAGLQIGAGAAVTPRSTPSSPLTPVVMPMPVITPVDGSVIATTTLSPGALGEPYALTVQAAAPAGTNVTLALNQPFANATGPSVAQHAVSAVDLLRRANGNAWSEYPGNAAAGDRSIALPDGRTRWLVTRADGRMQIYEPSANATFAYRIALGAPIIARGSTEYASGSTLAFDYAAYYAVQSGSASLKIDYPAAVRAVFGSQWGAQSIGFQWTFHDSAGAFSGDLRPFFLADALMLWADSITVAASGVVPAGAATDSATWTFNRVKSQLGVPVLSSAGDGAGFFAPGQMQFSAPNGPDGSAIGRLSFDSGANVSTGTTIAIAVIP